MTTNKTINITANKWTSLSDGSEVCLYKSNERILIYRRVMLTSWNGEMIRKYGYGLRSDDCTHTKKFIYNAVKHYLYVREVLSYGI